MWHRNFESESQNLQVEEPPKNWVYGKNISPAESNMVI